MEESLFSQSDLENEYLKSRTSDVLNRIKPKQLTHGRKRLNIKKQKHPNQHTLPFAFQPITFNNPLLELPDPMNKEQYLGLIPRQLKKESAYRHRLDSTFAIFHATQLLISNQQSSRLDRIVRTFLQILPPALILPVLDGIGRTTAFDDIVHSQDNPEGALRFVMYKNQGDYLSNLKCSVAYFMQEMEGIGRRHSSYTEETHSKTVWNPISAMNRLDAFRPEITEIYGNQINFREIGKRMIKSRGDKNPLDTTTVAFRGNVFVRNKEHPGVEYMERIIKFLKSHSYQPK